ncbi:MAG TPA: hypothetical protein VMV81_04960, partial [Phycisphaerae bacterium]|nr:hypothetical protein [Phycisphaerae bacterium]
MSDLPASPRTSAKQSGRIACWFLSAAVIACGLGLEMRRMPSVYSQGRWFLPDTDDYMRLFRVRMILDGKATIVRHIAEINAPAGATLHWTAPMDYLLVGAIRLSRWLGGGSWPLEQMAAWTPALLGAVYLGLVIFFMRRSLGWGPAIVGGLVMATSRGYHRVFQLGHCDHHCLIELFQWIGIAAIWPRRDDPNREPTRAGAIISGLAAGMALWVAAQAMLVSAAIFAGVVFATFYVPMERRMVWIARRREWNLALLAVLIVGWLIEQWPTPWRGELDKISLFHVLIAALGLLIPAGKTSSGQRVGVRLAAFVLGVIGFGFWFGAHRAAMASIFVRPEFYWWSATIAELEPLYLHAGGEWSIAPIAFMLGYLPYLLPVFIPVFLLSRELHSAAKLTLVVLSLTVTMLSVQHMRWIDHVYLGIMPISVIALFEMGRRIAARDPKGWGPAGSYLPTAVAIAALALLVYPSAKRVIFEMPQMPAPFVIRAALAADVINKYQKESPAMNGRRAILADQEAGPTMLFMTGLPIVAG